MLTKLELTWPYIFTLREFCVMWKVSMYVVYVCVSEGIRVKYIYLGSFLKVVLVKFRRICVNQGVGVFWREIILVENSLGFSFFLFFQTAFSRHCVTSSVLTMIYFYSADVCRISQRLLYCCVENTKEPGNKTLLEIFKSLCIVFTLLSLNGQGR